MLDYLIGAAGCLVVQVLFPKTSTKLLGYAADAIAWVKGKLHIT